MKPTPEQLANLRVHVFWFKAMLRFQQMRREAKCSGPRIS